MFTLPGRSTFNDASRPDDAPEFTYQYIRLGMPGWPSAGNVIPMTPSEAAACHPLEKRRLVTAHVETGHSATTRQRAVSGRTRRAGVIIEEASC